MFENQVASKEEAEARAKADYAAVLGKTIKTDFVAATIDSVTASFYAEGDDLFVVKVIQTPDADICHWNDEFLDPYWNVEVIDMRGQHMPSDAHPWMDGRSYHLPV